MGVGNLLHGDDGAGVRAVEFLRGRLDDPRVELVDAGTSVFDTLSALGGGRKLVVIDAIDGGGKAGDLYRVPYGELAAMGRGQGALTVHEVGLLESMPLLELAGVRWGEVVVIGVEPGDVTFGAGLSEAVASALPAVARIVQEEISGESPRP